MEFTCWTVELLILYLRLVCSGKFIDYYYMFVHLWKRSFPSLFNPGMLNTGLNSFSLYSPLVPTPVLFIPPRAV